MNVLKVLTICAAASSCGDALMVADLPEMPPVSEDVYRAPAGETSTAFPTDHAALDRPGVVDQGFWGLSCSGAPVPLPPTANVLFDGPNNFLHQLGDRDALSLAIGVTGCAAAEMPRNLVIAIDVSGSMDDSDPKVNRSCGRLRALDALIDGSRNAKFALITFSSRVNVRTLEFFDNKQALYNDVMQRANRNSIGDVVCEDSGGTDYREALLGAGMLFETLTDLRTSREIFFLSDGEPDRRKEGIDTAQDLRNDGITIGTVMLAGNDAILAQKIASRDAAGMPYHVKVSNASDLATAFTNLNASLSSLVAKVRYRTHEGWTEFGIARGKDFNSPAILLSLSATPQGLEVEFEYFDDQLQSYVVSSGKLGLKLFE